MASEIYTIEMDGVPGQSSAFSDKRNADASGVVDSIIVRVLDTNDDPVAVSDPNAIDDGQYLLIVTAQDGSPLRGRWKFKLGDALGTFGKVYVNLEEGVSEYYTDGGVNNILPSPADVRLGTLFGQNGELVGTLAVPAVGRVINGVAVDNTTGTFVYPIISTVNAGTTYGEDGTEFTGTLSVTGGSPPAPGDLRFGVLHQGVTGTLGLPGEGQVLLGVGFGEDFTEYEGSLEDLPASAEAAPPVLSSGLLRSPLYAGDSFLAANGNAFEWTVDPQTGMTTSATVRFYGWNSCDGPESPEWDVAGSVTLDGTNWLLSVDMTKLESAAIEEMEGYMWVLAIEEGDASIVLFAGTVDWVERV